MAVVIHSLTFILTRVYLKLQSAERLRETPRKRGFDYLIKFRNFPFIFSKISTSISYNFLFNLFMLTNFN